MGLAEVEEVGLAGFAGKWLEGNERVKVFDLCLTTCNIKRVSVGFWDGLG